MRSVREDTYVWLVLDEFQPSAVHDKNILQLGRTLLGIDFRRFDDVGRVLSLHFVNECFCND
jgi:hypothetical protein